MVMTPELVKAFAETALRHPDMMADFIASQSASNGSSPHTDLVFTSEEAATFLRVPTEVLLSEAEAGRLPGQKIGTEWRFLKLALVEWLHAGRKPASEPKPKSSKERMRELIGMWKDDPTVDAMVEEIYRERKRHPVGGK